MQDVDILVYKKLHNSVVRINAPDGSGRFIGTGVFVSPGAILTCTHVAKHEPKSVRYKNIELPIDKIECISPDSIYDISLIYVDYQNHPCVFLDGSQESLKFGDKFIAFGFTKECPEGEDVTLEYDGKSNSPGELPFIKLKEGQVVEGNSGSPLLNLRTGYVCGILKKSRNVYSDLGGRAISSEIILTEIKGLKTKQAEYHKFDILTEREKRILKLVREACSQTQPEEEQGLLTQILHRIQLEDSQDIIAEGVWYFEIARMLGNTTPKSIHDVLEIFSRYASDAAVKNLFLCLESSWVNSQSAETIREIIKKPQKQRAMSINSENSFVSQCYIEKANPHLPDKWIYTSAINRNGENQAEDLVNEIKEALIKKLEVDFISDHPGFLEIENCLKELEKRDSPTFVLVTKYVFDEVLYAIREKFPTLTFFFLDEQIPNNGAIQIDNQTLIQLNDQYVYFLAPPLSEEDLGATSAQIGLAKRFKGIA